jgi:hypothetical protein
MSNTVIQLKHSISPGNTPSSLANGEIAINGVDGKLYYSTPSGLIEFIETFPGPSGLDQEIQFNDSGVLGASANLKFNSVTKTLTTDNLLIGTLNVSPTLTASFNHANGAFNTANSATTLAQSAFNTANTANSTATSALSLAQEALDSAVALAIALG